MESETLRAAATERAIELLEARRTELIAAAASGQLDLARDGGART